MKLVGFLGTKKGCRSVGAGRPLVGAVNFARVDASDVARLLNLAYEKLYLFFANVLQIDE
jgi:hypothetical protein